MASDKIKRSKTEENDASEHTDPELVASIEKLQEVQDELEKLDEKASDEVLEVERKYNEIRRPIYDKRNEVIKTIPDFWLTAFLSHPVLSELLNEEDHEIFKHLESLDVCDFKDVKAGYSITFSFKTNPYFENSKLTKTFSFNDEGTTKITGATIKWKDGRLTSNGKAEESKGKKRSLSDESFFSWFGESEEHEVPGVIQDEVADMIREELWGNPLKYFNNELSDDEMEGDDSEENDDDTDSSDDDNNDSMEENGN